MHAQQLRQLVCQAAEICYDLEGRLVDAHLKSEDPNDLCSEMDEQVSALARQMLSHSGFFNNPANLYLDEENQAQFDYSRICAADELFVIDPIDGSGAAMEGRPEYCIMAAHYKRNADGVFIATCAAMYRPRTMELMLWDGENVTYTEYLGTARERTRSNLQACSPHKPNNMLMDYRFYHTYVWDEQVPGNKVPKVHLNPSGFNMGDVALNRGLGFLFVYKPWDVCALPIAQALGCKAYLLTAQADGSFSADETPSYGLDLRWFAYDETKREFGKITKPLLVCRPQNLAAILTSLKLKQV